MYPLIPQPSGDPQLSGDTGCRRQTGTDPSAFVPRRPTPNPERPGEKKIALTTLAIQHPRFCTGEFPDQKKKPKRITRFKLLGHMANRCRLLRFCFPNTLRGRASQKGPRASDDPLSEARRRSRVAARPKSPYPHALRKQPRNGSITRSAVVAWKRVTRVLRCESKRGVPAGFALIIPHPRRKPRSDPESAETSLAATCSDTGSEWSLV